MHDRIAEEFNIEDKKGLSRAIFQAHVMLYCRSAPDDHTQDRLDEVSKSLIVARRALSNPVSLERLA
jgi:hypothetical protein